MSTVETSASNSYQGLRRPLQQLVADEHLQGFLEAAWPRRYLVHHAGPERLPGWMRAPELGNVATLRSLCPTAKLTANHPHVAYQAVLEGGDPQLVEILLLFGLTLSFSDLAPSIPGARPWLDNLARDLGVAKSQVDLALFVSAPGRGLLCHFDAYDAFVVQLHGSKTWRVGHAPAVQWPVGTQYVPATRPSELHAAMMPSGLPETNPEGLDELELHPGSVLFVPRGTWHQTAASTSTSISASIFLNVPSIGEFLLQQLKKVVLQDPRLRAPAIGFAGHNQQQQQRAVATFERAVAPLQRNVAQLSAQAGFEASAPASELSASIQRSTRFVRDWSRVIELDGTELDGDGNHLLRVNDGPYARPLSKRAMDTLVVPPAALPVLGWIMERRGTFAASAVADAFSSVDFGSLAVLLTEMVAVNALVLLPFGPCASIEADD